MGGGGRALKGPTYIVLRESSGQTYIVLRESSGYLGPTYIVLRESSGYLGPRYIVLGESRAPLYAFRNCQRKGKPAHPNIMYI